MHPNPGRYKQKLETSQRTTSTGIIGNRYKSVSQSKSLLYWNRGRLGSIPESVIYHLIQIPLLDHHVFPNNKPLRSHFAEAGKDSRDMFFEINKNEHHRQVAA